MLSAETLQAIASRALRFEEDYDELLDVLADACSGHNVMNAMNQIRLAVMQLKHDASSVQHSRTFRAMAEKEARLQELVNELSMHPEPEKVLHCKLSLIHETLDTATIRLKEQYEEVKEWIAAQKRSTEWDNAKSCRRRQLRAITNDDVVRRIEDRANARQAEANTSSMGSVSSCEDTGTRIIAVPPSIGNPNHIGEAAELSCNDSDEQSVESKSLVDKDKTTKPYFSKKTLERISASLRLKKMEEALIKANETIESFKESHTPPRKSKRAPYNPHSKISNGVNRRKKNEADAYCYFAVFGPFFNFFKLGMSKNKPYELIRPYTRVNGPCVLLWRVRILGDDSIRQARGKY